MNFSLRPAEGGQTFNNKRLFSFCMPGYKRIPPAVFAAGQKFIPEMGGGQGSFDPCPSIMKKIFLAG